MDHISLEKRIATEYIAFIDKYLQYIWFYFILLTNSYSLESCLPYGKVSSSCLLVIVCTSAAQPSLKYLSGCQPSTEACILPCLPTSRPHRDLEAQFLEAPCMNMDEIRPAPLLLLLTWLEDDEDVVLPVLPHSFFPGPLSVEPYNTQGIRKKIFFFQKSQWKFNSCTSFSSSSISNGMFLMKR